IRVLPGPSAVLAALAVSGLPVDRFCFEGFLPRRPGERRRRLEELAAEPRTMVFFEAPRRTAAALAAMAEVFGADRRVAVCRELTKVHEEVRRGSVDELAAWAETGVLGEVTLVVAGADPSAHPAPSAADLAARVDALEADGMSRRDAIAEVARSTGVRRRDVYDAAHRG
ncbi:MAG TPA: SAM-dependent methyltransferase, partial [Nocardioidaceae bacterium]|nr:SAM-dependent methyltransferase [Nocardioidaceae bacterium]